MKNKNDYSQDDLKKGYDIRQKLIDVSKEVLDTSDTKDKIVEFYEYCISQSLHQLEYSRTKESFSTQQKLKDIKEYSMNLANYSLAIYATIEEVENIISKDKNFTSGYINWNTYNRYLVKQLNDNCTIYFNDLKRGINIIDALKILYRNIVINVKDDIDLETENSKEQKTKYNVLDDTNILESFKLFIKYQCLSNFILSYDEIYEMCKDSYINPPQPVKIKI